MPRADTLLIGNRSKCTRGCAQLSIMNPYNSSVRPCQTHAPQAHTQKEKTHITILGGNTLYITAGNQFVNLLLVKT